MMNENNWHMMVVGQDIIECPVYPPLNRDVLINVFDGEKNYQTVAHRNNSEKWVDSNNQPITACITAWHEMPDVGDDVAYQVTNNWIPVMVLRPQNSNPVQATCFFYEDRTTRSNIVAIYENYEWRDMYTHKKLDVVFAWKPMPSYSFDKFDAIVSAPDSEWHNTKEKMPDELHEVQVAIYSRSDGKIRIDTNEIAVLYRGEWIGMDRGYGSVIAWKEIDLPYQEQSNTKKQNKWEKLFDQYLNEIGFELIRHENCYDKYSEGYGHWSLLDKQGSPLGDIESERFENAAAIIDRTEIYAEDSIVNYLVEQINYVKPDTVKCRGTGEWSSLLKYRDLVPDDSTEMDMLDMICNHYEEIDLNNCNYRHW